jgi:hypothetical protein
MTDVLETVIEAPWWPRALESAGCCHGVARAGRALWGIKGHAEVLDDVFVGASLH